MTLQPKVGRKWHICAFLPATLCSLHTHSLVGFVTCLKDGCNKNIELIRRVRAYDGGKADGLGSLSAYRVRSASFWAMESRLNRVFVI